MKANREALLTELEFAASVVNRRATIPAIANILLEAKDGRLKLVGTDLDRTAITSLPLEDSTEEAYCVPCFDLLNALRNSESEFAELTEAKARVTVQCGKSKFVVAKVEAKHFIQIEKFKDEGFQVCGDLLSEVIRLTSFAGNTRAIEANRQVIFFKNNGTFSAFAYNGIISSLIECELKLEKEFDFSIPSFAASAILQICDNSEDVTIQFDIHHIGITGGSRQLITRRIVAEPPAYEKGRAEDANHSFIVSAQTLLKAIKSSQSLDDLIESGDNGRFTRLTFESRGTEVKIHSQNKEAEFESTFPAESVSEFELFKLNAFQLQHLVSGMKSNPDLRFKTTKAKINVFVDTDNFKVELMQANLRF